MTNNNFITKQQRLHSRSFSEIIAVYKKIAKFYFYNLYLQRNGSMVISLLLYLLSATIIFPLSLLASFFPALREFLERFFSSRPIYNIALAKVEIPQIVGIVARFHGFFVPTGSVLKGIEINGYFSLRMPNSGITFEEKVIISCVKDIRSYDLFFFESIMILLFQILHFFVVFLGGCLFVPSNPFKAFIICWPLIWNDILVYFCFSSFGSLSNSFFSCLNAITLLSFFSLPFREIPLIYWCLVIAQTALSAIVFYVWSVPRILLKIKKIHE